jgi:hypothetical protein
MEALRPGIKEKSMSSTAPCDGPRIILSDAASALFNVATGEVLTPRPGVSDVPFTSQRPRAGVEVGTNRWTILPSPAILQHLKAIESLESDWDSYGSEAPSAQAVAAARSLISTVHIASLYARGKRADPHAILPLSGGGIQIEWRGEGRAIEVEVGRDGTFGYLLAKGQEPLRQFEEGDGVPRSQIVELVWSVIE